MDMKQMMRQAQKMQKELAKAQDEVSDMRFESSAGGGMVTAVVTGSLTLESIAISPDVLESGDIEILQDMICVAVNNAMEQARSESEQRLGSISGGMNLPGMPGM